MNMANLKWLAMFLVFVATGGAYKFKIGNKLDRNSKPSAAEKAEIEFLKKNLKTQYVQKIIDGSGSPECESLEECLDELYNGSKPKAIKGFIEQFPSGRISERQFVIRLTKESHGKHEKFWIKIFKQFDTEKKGLSFSQLMLAKQKISMNA